MLDELYRLPENMTEWNTDTIRTINKIFEHIHKHSANIEYATTAPTKLDYGTFSIFDDGTDRALFYKTGKGTVMSTIPSRGVIMWSGAEADIPTGWYLCDGNNGTPDMRDKFVVGAGTGGSYAVAATGGAVSVTLTTANIPAHTHTLGARNDNNAAGDTNAAVRAQADNASITTDSGGGSGGSHENLPPYYALCYIMKA